MAQEPNFDRKPLLCPKCQSPSMVIQEIREMWENPRPSGAMPAFNACFEQRILCADCGVEVWPKKWVAKEPVNPVSGVAGSGKGKKA